MTNAEVYINKIYPGTNWSVDNFGPYIVPPDHYFVMGDNRHNSQDSRYTGPIPVKDLQRRSYRKTLRDKIVATKMKLQHLSPILWTKDLEQTISFYETVLGFTKKTQFPNLFHSQEMK